MVGLRSRSVVKETNALSLQTRRKMTHIKPKSASEVDKVVRRRISTKDTDAGKKKQERV